MKLSPLFIALLMIGCSFSKNEKVNYNGLKAIVNSNSPWVALGGDYKSTVYFNREIKHEIIVDSSNALGFQFKINKEEIQITKNCKEEGIEKLYFKVYFSSKGYVIDSLSISEEFIVARPPSTLLNSTAGSVLNLNKKNELLFSVGGISNRKLKLETDNGRIEVKDDFYPSYQIIPTKLGICTLKAYDMTSGESKYLFEREFNVIKY